MNLSGLIWTIEKLSVAMDTVSSKGMLVKRDLISKLAMT